MKKVALVIGHKESSPGAVNDELGVTEFAFNEPLAYSIAEKLRLESIEPFIVYRDTYGALPEKVNDTGADICISLHCNAFNDNPNGTETLYFKGSSKGAQLAWFMQREVVDCLGTKDRGLKPCTYDHVGKAGDRGGWLLAKTSMPCVICEPFFIDSLESLNNAQSKFEQLADAYVSGIKEYFESGL